MKKYGIMLLALLACGAVKATQDATLTQRQVRDPRQLETYLEANATDAETRIAAVENTGPTNMPASSITSGNLVEARMTNGMVTTIGLAASATQPGDDWTNTVSGVLASTIESGAAAGATAVQPADVWGAPTATPSPTLLVNAVTIQAKTAAGGDLSEFRLIRVWTSETSMGAASTNNIETLVLSTGTAVDTVVAHADYRYVTATDGSALATITGTATGTNYVMVSDGSSISATAITFIP